MRKRVLM
jgi:hypothetical protein